MDRKIFIFDTTLRDGEQSPGCSMNLEEKIEVARQLERLKVDIIEAGFAISSKGDFESIETIAKTVKDCTVASLSRALEKDIDASYEAVRHAQSPLIHTFIATSPIHMEYKLRMTPDRVLEQAEALLAGRVLVRGRHPQRAGVPCQGAAQGHCGGRYGGEYPRYRGLHHPRGDVHAD